MQILLQDYFDGSKTIV